MSKGRIFKRCGCRDEDGKRLGASCPKLKGAQGAWARNHGAWAVVVDVGTEGARRQLTKAGFTLKEDAQAWLDDVVEAAKGGGAVKINPRLTVAEWLDEWIADRTSTTGVTKYGPTIRHNTAVNYRLHIGYLKEYVGHVKLLDLDADHIQAAYDRMSADSEARARAVEERQELANADRVAKGRPVVAYAHVKRLGRASIARIHACLSASLKAAVKARRKPFNPCSQVTLAKSERRTLPQWTPEQLGAFLDAAAGDRLGLVFEVVAAAGLRRGEALGLRWADVNLRAGTIRVERQLLNAWADGAPVFGDPKSVNGRRDIALPASTLDALKLHRLEQDDEREKWGAAYQDFDLVFCQANGRPYDPAMVTKRFGALSAAAGLPHIRLHDLRHAAGTRWYANGVPLAVVSKRLGHASYSFTVDVYGHKDEAADKLAAEAGWDAVRREPKKRDVSPM